MKKRDVLNSPRLRALRRKRRRVLGRKVFLSILGLVALIALLSYFSRSQKLNIGTIQISGNKVVDAESIKNAAKEQMAGYYLGLFPKTNFLLYPKRAIRRELLQEFTRLNGVSFNLQDLNTLQISVSERAAAFVWCGATPPESTVKDKCYFLDKGGFVFDQAPYFSGKVYLAFYGSDGIVPESPAGSHFAPTIFGQLASLTNSIIQMGLKPESVWVGEDGNIKVLLPAAKSGAPNPYIVFKADANFGNIAENLQAALGTEPLLSEFKNKYSSMQYIDLRYGNKVYFKF